MGWLRWSLLVLVHFGQRGEEVCFRNAQCTKLLLGVPPCCCCRHDVDEHVVSIGIIAVLKSIRPFRKLQPSVTDDARHGSFPQNIVPSLEPTDREAIYLFAHTIPHDADTLC